MLKTATWIGVAAATALSATSAQSAERVSFLMSWKPQAEQGGYYQALAKGYYTDCGVDMVIRQGGPGIDTAQLLVGNAVDFDEVDAPFRIKPGDRVIICLPRRCRFQIVVIRIPTTGAGRVCSIDGMKFGVVNGEIFLHCFTRNALQNMDSEFQSQRVNISREWSEALIAGSGREAI